MNPSEPNGLVQLAQDQIVPAKGNRRALDLDQDFLDDVKARGVLQPIIVRPSGRKFEIVVGERRWAANGRAGHKTIPALVRAINDKEAREIRLAENLQRKDLNALDEARQLQDCLAAGDYGTGREAVTALAAKINKSVAHVYSRLRLLKLTGPARAALDKGTIPHTIAALLARIEDEKLQATALEEIIEGTWGGPMSFREAQEHLEGNYAFDLKHAPFDRSAELVPGVGPCVTCPKRMANMPDGDPKRPNVCTDPGCYQRKKEAHGQALLTAAKANGKQVLEGKAASSLFWPKSENLRARNYVAADDKHYLSAPRDADCKTYRELLKGHLEPVIAVDGKGQVRELFPSREADAAFVKAGYKWATERQTVAARQKKERAKEKEDKSVRSELLSRVVTACAKVISAPKLTEKLEGRLWALVVRATLEFCGDYKHICQRQRCAESSFDVFDNPRWLKADLNVPNVRLTALELLVSSWDGYDRGGVNDLAAVCGVDMAKIEKELRAELAPKNKAKPATQKPKAKRKANNV
jgi:ParB/RepB/Spo0J family partition protein